MASVARLNLISGALVATTNGSTKVLEALSENFVAWLNVSANDGSTTVAAKLQHSADGTNWVDLGSAFTNVVNTTGVQALQLNVNILPYVRGVATLTGVSATVEISLYYDKKK
jgi:hypothetical protein